MSKTIMRLVLLASVVFVAACSQRASTDAQAGQQEFVIVEPAPVSVEPAFTGNFK